MYYKLHYKTYLVIYFSNVNAVIILGTSRNNRNVFGHDPENRSGDEDLELPLFGLCTIHKATNNFSMKNKLGEGGFGPVYKVR